MQFELCVLSNGIEKKLLFDNVSNSFVDLESKAQLLSTTKVLGYKKHQDQFNINFSDIGVLFINLGLRCNFSCKYCHQNNFRKSTKVCDFTPTKVEGFLNILKRSKVKMKAIAFWGGEPLVYWKTLKVLIPKVRELYPSVIINFPTNGSLLTREIINFLELYNIGFYISYDGKKTNRDVSIFDDEKLIEAIRNMNKGLSIMPTQNRASIPIKQIKDEFKDYKIKLSSISPYSIARCNPYNREQADEILIPFEKCCEHSEFIYDVLHSNVSDIKLYRGLLDRFNFILGIYYRGLGVDSVDVNFCCNSIGKDICIDCTGNIFNCMNIPLHIVGNLLDFSSFNSQSIFKNHLYKNKCLACPYVSCCRGGCPLIHDDESIEFKVNCNNLKIIAVPFFRTMVERLLGVYLKRITRYEDQQLIAEF